MKILVVEEYGGLLSLVMALENEGHDVSWFIGDEDQRDVGDGLVDAVKPDAWSPLVKEADLILLAGYPGNTAKSLQKQGKLVVGGQYDKDFTKKLAKSAGIKVASEGLEGEKIYIGSWYNQYQFVKPYFLSHKNYGLLPNDEGPDIFMSIKGRFQGKHPLFHDILRKLGVFLRANKYAGYVECKAILSNGKVFFDGLTTNLSNPSVLMQMELIREPWGNFLHRLAGGNTKSVKVMSRHATGLQIWTLPCPLSYMTRAFNGIPVEFPSGWKHIHPVQVKKDGILVTAGTSGNVCQCVGHAMTQKTATERALSMIKTIKVQDKMYRDLQLEEMKICSSG